MRTLLLSTVAFAALAGSAFAADLPSRKEAPVYVAPTPVFSWTGFYVGADLGGDFGSTKLTDTYTGLTTNRSLNTSGVLGGGYVGYNYQVNQNFVLGVEGDFQGSSNSNTTTWVDTAGNGWQLKTQQNWLASINGRLGVAYDRALFYAIGGAAWAQGTGTLSFATLNVPPYAAVSGSSTNTLSGWDIGGGIEYAFTPNWVGRVEYRYYDFNNYNLNSNGLLANLTNVRETTSINTVRVGLAYLFSAPAPVVAKY
jgi:outer membrane immunogenic protein